MIPSPHATEPPGSKVLRPFKAVHAILLAITLAVVFALPALDGGGRALDYGANFSRFIDRLWPPNFSVLPDALAALVETIQIAILATSFCFIAAIPLAMAGAGNLSPRLVVSTTRLLLNAIRTIPSLIWAVLAVAVVGANSLAGVIALAFYSLGYLGKFFADAFESSSLEVMRGLRDSGASRIQAFQHGLWPMVKPLILSQTLWMLEYNIRSASIIGYVGAVGIGLQLHTYVEYGAWDSFAAVLVLLFVVVLLLDQLGSHLRRALGES